MMCEYGGQVDTAVRTSLIPNSLNSYTLRIRRYDSLLLSPACQPCPFVQ